MWGKLLMIEFPGFLFGAATNHGLLTHLLKCALTKGTVWWFRRLFCRATGSVT